MTITEAPPATAADPEREAIGLSTDRPDEWAA
jgi:hypothetical protein